MRGFQIEGIGDILTTFDSRDGSAQAVDQIIQFPARQINLERLGRVLTGKEHEDIAADFGKAHISLTRLEHCPELLQRQRAWRNHAIFGEVRKLRLCAQLLVFQSGQPVAHIDALLGNLRSGLRLVERLLRNPELLDLAAQIGRLAEQPRGLIRTRAQLTRENGLRLCNPGAHENLQRLEIVFCRRTIVIDARPQISEIRHQLIGEACRSIALAQRFIDHFTVKPRRLAFLVLPQQKRRQPRLSAAHRAPFGILGFK